MSRGAPRRLGYDSIWAGDHVSFQNPILDVTVALTTFAAVTSRITIGAGIVLLPLRQPRSSRRSSRRSTTSPAAGWCSVSGVGGEGAKDFEAVGVPIARARRAHRRGDARAAGAVRRLGRRASRAGSTRFEGISIEPLPAQPGGPPLWVGGRSERGAPARGDARRRLDADLGLGGAVRRERTRSALRRGGGRDPTRSFRPRSSRRSSATTASGRGRCAEHLEERYADDFSAHASSATASPARRRSARRASREYAEAGVRHVVFNPAVAPDGSSSRSSGSRRDGGGRVTLPLADVRVVAIEQFGAGPWGTLQLADLGAEVIKIEDPAVGGDVGRYVPPFQEGEDSLFFETFNRNKKSVSLDLRHPEARGVFEDLVRVSRRRLLEPARRPAGASSGSPTTQLKDVNPRDRLLLAVRLRDDRPARRRRAATTT